MHSPICDNSLGQLLARFGAACRDVNLHAIFDVGSGDHLAETATATGDDRDLAAHREKLFDFHFGLLIIGGAETAALADDPSIASNRPQISQAVISRGSIR